MCVCAVLICDIHIPAMTPVKRANVERWWKKKKKGSASGYPHATGSGKFWFMCAWKKKMLSGAVDTRSSHGGCKCTLGACQSGVLHDDTWEPIIREQIIVCVFWSIHRSRLHACWKDRFVFPLGPPLPTPFLSFMAFTALSRSIFPASAFWFGPLLLSWFHNLLCAAQTPQAENAAAGSGYYLRVAAICPNTHMWPSHVTRPPLSWPPEHHSFF